MSFTPPPNAIDNRFDPLPFMQASALQKKADFETGWQGAQFRNAELANQQMESKAKLMDAYSNQAATMAAMQQGAQQANYMYGEEAEKARMAKTLMESTAAYDTHAATLQAINDAKLKHEQSVALFDVEKKKQEIALEEASLKNQYSQSQIDMMREIMNLNTKKNKQVLDAKNLMLNEAEHEHLTAAEQAKATAAQSLVGIMRLTGAQNQFIQPDTNVESHADRIQAMRDSGFNPDVIFKDTPIYVPKDQKDKDPIILAQKEEQRQDRLEKIYADRVQSKILSARSGGLGLQDAKVNQAFDLMKAIDANYDAKTGQYIIPPAMHVELALGLARLLSPTGVPHESVIRKLQQVTAREGMAGAAIYLGADPKKVGGSTQSVINFFIDSIIRQGEVAEELRNKYINDAKGIPPKDLDPDRASVIRDRQYGSSFKSYLKDRNDFLNKSNHLSRLTATNPKDNQKIYSEDGGNSWYDVKTGKAIK